MTANSFRTFWDLGYTRLLPITPPDAKPSEKSALHKRPKAIGKAPGVKRADGTWQGIDLVATLATEADLDTWHAMGAGVGIRTGDGLVALDIDTLDEALADRAQQLALEHLAISPVRIGRWPKRLMLFRTTEATPYRRVKFEGGLVELLSDGRQFVAHGVHPQTFKPYEWQPHAWPYDSIEEVTAAQLESYFAAVAMEFPAAEVATSNLPTANAAVDQRQLLGEPDAVQRAVAALPNTTELFPTYDDYVRVGYAIKGATQDDAHGLELFQEWAAKWDGGNDPDVVAADWHRMKPPFSVGAQYLYSLAQQHGAFSTGDAWFQPGSASASPFDAVAAEPAAPTIEPLVYANLNAWHTSEPPEREWMVDNFIPREGVTLVYGDGGVGKTLVMHQYAVCAAAGVPWLGQTTRPAKVLCVFCEDSSAELHRRHRAILKSTGADPAAVVPNLRILARAGEDNILATFSRSNGAMQRTAFWQQLARDIDEWEADVVILDTLADIFGGSEIDRTQVNSFIKTGLGRLGGKRQVPVVALGHPSVAGRVEGRSGSTAWAGASRYRNYMRRPKGKEKSDLREFEGTKTNNAALGNMLQIKWKSGAFSLIAESKPIDLNALKNSGGDSTALGALRAPTVEEREEAAVLTAIAAAHAEKLPLSLSAKSWKTYAPKVLRTTYPDIMDLVRTDEGVADGIVRKLLSGGRVRETKWRDPGTRHPVSGFEVVTAAAAPSGGVFN